MYDQFINLSVKPYNKTKGCLNLNYVNASSSNNKGSTINYNFSSFGSITPVVRSFPGYNPLASSIKIDSYKIPQIWYLLKSIDTDYTLYGETVNGMISWNNVNLNHNNSIQIINNINEN